MNNVIENKSIIENNLDEQEDDILEDKEFSYEIISYGADFSFREIINMYDEDELIKPELQRKYVWDKIEAGRFIESILMGLPVPSVFFAISGSQKLIVDGYQRIMTVHDYIYDNFNNEGSFSLPNSKKINIKWRGKKFKQLSIDEQRKIKSTTIHAIIFQQTKPETGNASLYQIFERINTSGRSLTPQEIRNCIFQGKFNTLLFELNKDKFWRKLFGEEKEDSRMADIEQILRFFVMKSDIIRKTTLKQISLKKSLNDFMDLNKNASDEIIEEFRNDFLVTIKSIYENLGIHAFNNYIDGNFTNMFNPSIYDSISVAFYDKLKNGKNAIKISSDNVKKLLQDINYKSAISSRTTNVENIKTRISLAKKYLFK